MAIGNTFAYVISSLRSLMFSLPYIRLRSLFLTFAYVLVHSPFSL